MVQKIALTGAPGSGKSSILREMELTYEERIIPEAAEDIIRYLQTKGNPRPWELLDFQDRILDLQIQREKQIENIGGRVFMDRGILDGLAYYQLKGKTPSESMLRAIEESNKRYKKVFLIELGNDCQKTGIRREDLREAKELERLQYENYTKAGYKVERVPYLGIEKRAKIILDILFLSNLEEWKGGEENGRQK